jgi:hypothetical protein
MRAMTSSSSKSNNEGGLRAVLTPTKRIDAIAAALQTAIDLIEEVLITDEDDRKALARVIDAIEREPMTRAHTSKHMNMRSTSNE